MSFNLRNALSNAFVGGGGGGATLAANTFTGAQVISANGAASTPALSLTGTIFTGGSATTTKPQLLIEPSGTTSTNWSANGTLLGLNAPAGFTGSVAAGQINAVNVFDFKSSLVSFFSGANLLTFTPVVNGFNIGGNAGSYWQANPIRAILGSWSYSDYYIQGPDAGPGNTNRSTGNVVLHSGISTGSGTGGSVILANTAPGSSGTSNNALVNRFIVDTHGVIQIKSATTVPSSNPTGGGYLYDEGGALKWRSTAGTVTTIAPL